MEDLIDNSTIDKANSEYSKCKGLLPKPVHQVDMRFSVCLLLPCIRLILDLLDKKMYPEAFETCEVCKVDSTRLPIRPFKLADFFFHLFH